MEDHNKITNLKKENKLRILFHRFCIIVALLYGGKLVRDRVQNMKIQIFLVPYESGNKDAGMGRGPFSFIEAGLLDILHKDGHEVDVDSIEQDSSFSTAVSSAFELSRLLSHRVNQAISTQRFPIVLSGTSTSSVGTLGGANQDDTGLIWFDAHGDFNTPETTTSGSMDGMALAIATGHCWRMLSGTIPGFQPVAERNTILIGAREFDPEEKRQLDCSGIALVSRSFIRSMNIVEALKPAVDDLQSRVQRVHIHLDLDVLDPVRNPSNRFAPPDGLPLGAVEIALRLIEARFLITSACIAAYDPECDPERATVRAGIILIQTLLRRTR
jgi:arginase